MGKQVNLKILFPEEELDNQWIIDLIACLRFACQKVLYGLVECNIQTPDRQKISQAPITGSDYFVVILGSESNDSDSFQESLKFLSDKLYVDNKEKISFSRLFKILLKPNSRILQPDSLIPYTGYDFFDYTHSGSTTKQYEITSHDIKIWSCILDIIYDLKQAINLIDGKESTARFVYLANCSVDQKANYNDIKRELQHFNIRVLPMVGLPEGTEQMRLLVETTLEKCDLAIQIVGGRYGEVKRGDKISVYEKENNIIQDYLKEHPEKFRLIWKPADLKLNDSRQNLYLNRLMKDGTSQNSKIIEASLDEFKDIIAKNIRTPESVFNTKNKASGLYLMSNKSDDTTMFEEVARAYKIDVLKEIEEGNGHFYMNHLNNLKTIPNVVIFYSDNSSGWLNSKLGDIIKVIGMGRDVPLNSIAIIGNQKPHIEEYQKWLPDIEFYTLNNKEAIETFIKKCL